MFDARNYEKVLHLIHENELPFDMHNICQFHLLLYSLKGPFEIFSVGGDLSDANIVKFSNDGRLMLLTTTDGHIHVLDSFRGTLVSCFHP